MVRAVGVPPTLSELKARSLQSSASHGDQNGSPGENRTRVSRATILCSTIELQRDWHVTGESNSVDRIWNPFAAQQATYEIKWYTLIESNYRFPRIRRK